MPLPQLEKQCLECKGEKYIRNPVWQEWDERLQQKVKAMGYKVSNLSIEWIDENCPMPDIDEPEFKICDECEGRGTIPTEEGYMLLSFLEKYSH